MHKEEGGVLEAEMGEIDECDMDEFYTLDRREKTITILGDRWWPQAAKKEGNTIISKNISM